MTKNFLNDMGVDFIEKNIELNEEYREEALSYGLKALPIVKTPEQVFHGFRPAILETLV